MEQIFLSMPEDKFQVFVIDCMKAVLDNYENKVTAIAEPELPVSVRAAAEHLDCDEQTIYRMLRAGDIPGHKKMSRWYFFRSELNEWIKNK